MKNKKDFKEIKSFKEMAQIMGHMPQAEIAEEFSNIETKNESIIMEKSKIEFRTEVSLIKEKEKENLINQSKDIILTDRYDVDLNAHQIMQRLHEKIIFDMPLSMRTTYLLNIIRAAELKDSQIDWGKINYYLNTKVDKYDFSYFYKIIGTIEELETLRFNIATAGLGVGAWVENTCKDCGEKFYMEKTEVDFYERKVLDLPKRCKKCRDKRTGMKFQKLIKEN